MDRQLLERLIGAGVLVLCLVIIAPAILDGPADTPVTAPNQTLTSSGEPRRVHTIRLDERSATPPVAREVAPSREQAESTDSGPGEATGNQPGQIVRPETKVVRTPQPVPEPARTADRESPAEPPPAKPRATPVAPATQPGWAVQLGSFSNRDNAQQLAKRVGNSGFPVFLSSVDRSGQKLYRVRVGPLQSRPQAEELAGRLSQAGYTGQVTQQ